MIKDVFSFCFVFFVKYLYCEASTNLDLCRCITPLDGGKQKETKKKYIKSWGKEICLSASLFVFCFCVIAFKTTVERHTLLPVCVSGLRGVMLGHTFYHYSKPFKIPHLPAMLDGPH